MHPLSDWNFCGSNKISVGYEMSQKLCGSSNFFICYYPLQSSLVIFFRGTSAEVIILSPDFPLHPLAFSFCFGRAKNRSRKGPTIKNILVQWFLNIIFSHLRFYGMIDNLNKIDLAYFYYLIISHVDSDDVGGFVIMWLLQYTKRNDDIFFVET